MTPIRTLALLAFAGLLAPTAATAEDQTVNLEGVHMCCNACVRDINETVADVEGATVQCDRIEGVVAITAPDVETAQQAVDAITDAGYHGMPDTDAVEVKHDSGVEDGGAESLTLTGFHNCCRACAAAIKEAIDEVHGVEEAAVEPRDETVEVSGDFFAPAVVKALNKAGFHVKVKK